MKKFLIVLLMITTAIATGCTNNAPLKEDSGPQDPDKDPKTQADIYGPANPSYKMDINYNHKKHIISGTMTVQFVNNIDKTLEHLYFNLWPNADVFTSSGGGISVGDVKVNGETAKFAVNKTKLDISDLVINEDEQVTVKMKFKVKIPQKQDRFGWHETTVSLGNWFPILAVYDAEGWNLDPYYGHGDSFYSLTGDFEVTFTADHSLVVAATGVETEDSAGENGRKTYHFMAENVRDFAMQLNSEYKIQKTTVNNVAIRVYYTDEQKKYVGEFLKIAEESIQQFSEKFGDYPWPELDIVTMEGWFGGMEYPQLVMISLSEEFPDEFIMTSVAHEIAHQWFYGIVGNNSYDEPWLDEAFATFAEKMYHGKLEYLTAPPPQDPFHLSSPVSVFAEHADEGGSRAYARIIYRYGAHTVNELRKLLGDEQFYESLRTYFEKKKFDISTTAHFIRIMEETSGKDLSGFFKEHEVYVSE